MKSQHKQRFYTLKQMRQQIFGDRHLKKCIWRTKKQHTCSKQIAQPDVFYPSFYSNQLKKFKNLYCKNFFRLAWKWTWTLAAIACVCAKYCCYSTFLLLMPLNYENTAITLHRF